MRLYLIFFIFLKGSEGKLTSLNQKLSLLTAVGNLSYNAVLGTTSIETLALSVIELLLPLLQEGLSNNLKKILKLYKLLGLVITIKIFFSMVKKFLIDYFRLK